MNRDAMVPASELGLPDASSATSGSASSAMPIGAASSSPPWRVAGAEGSAAAAWLSLLQAGEGGWCCPRGCMHAHCLALWTPPLTAFLNALAGIAIGCIFFNVCLLVLLLYMRWLCLGGHRPAQVAEGPSSAAAAGLPARDSASSLAATEEGLQKASNPSPGACGGQLGGARRAALSSAGRRDTWWGGAGQGRSNRLDKASPACVMRRSSSCGGWGHGVPFAPQASLL